MVDIAGRPLIDYVIQSAHKSMKLDSIACSTDHDAIASFCRQEGVSIIERPANLGDDSTPVADVLCHAVSIFEGWHGFMPGILVLLQPTSPFVQPHHVDTLVQMMMEDPLADSAQTITDVPHNHHAFNQRVTEGKWVKFRFAEERKHMYNKQLKPKHFVFGNLVVTRTKCLLEGRGVFGERSLYHQIPSVYALDVDSAEDVVVAEYLLHTNRLQTA